MKKKTGFSALLAAYALLLFALTAAEAPHPDSGIRSLWDALWYSLVTITTVGYGDLYPVSPAGKVIGVFFLLLSVGALAFAVSLAYAALTGSLIPRARLWLHRKKPWFLFSGVSDASAALAGDISRVYPGSLIVFCSSGGKALSGPCTVPVQKGMERILPLAKGHTAAFFTGCDPVENAAQALSILHAQTPPADVFCMGAESSGAPGVSFFDPFTCCARSYWQTFPLAPQERTVVLVGGGQYARALLSQALTAGCRAPFAATSYHLFGDWAEYRRSHPLLCRALSGGQSPAQDALLFHDAPWNDDISLLETADRILFCADDEAENARLACQLDRLYPHRASVYVRCANSAVPGTRFGQPGELYTCELVMQQALDSAARAMHEAYRQNAARPVPEWDALSGVTKASNRAAADHMLTKVRLLLSGEDIRAVTPDICRRAYAAYLSGGAPLRELCRENEHERWMRFHQLYNWQYAPVRDNAMRRHPSLIPYAELSEPEKAKDDTAWAELDRFAGSNS